jgi:hypothetical protein
MLELTARGGMRIGEVLKPRLQDLQDRKLVLSEPYSIFGSLSQGWMLLILS